VVAAHSSQMQLRAGCGRVTPHKCRSFERGGLLM